MVGRRFGLYFAWSRPQELSADLGVLENRYPTLFEFRRALWPHVEHLRDPARYAQGIAGFLDHVVLSDFALFQKLIREETGYDVSVIQRADNEPPRHIDNNFLKDIDTLIVVSLDHYRTGQEASREELEALRAFLGRKEHCLVVCPHHDIGADNLPASQQVEFNHHADRLVPAQQRIGGFARSVLSGFGFPIENRFGLNPARLADGSPAPLYVNRDLDKLGVLQSVTTFNMHPHLPHLFVPPQIVTQVDVLAQQQINLGAPIHPFIEAGNRVFNALLQLQSSSYAGQILVCDATLWSSAFGGLESLQAFWRNLARLPK
jgi:hypothetical protein